MVRTHVGRNSWHAFLKDSKRKCDNENGRKQVGATTHALFSSIEILLDWNRDCIVSVNFIGRMDLLLFVFRPRPDGDQ